MVNKAFSLNFPEIILPDEHTTQDQLDKIRDELTEATADIIFDRREDALHECVDVLIAAETLYRLLVKRAGIEKVNMAISWVNDKNHKRGYYREAS